MEQWLQLISTYGVSIVAMVALGVYVVKKDKEHREITTELQQTISQIVNTHKEEIDELRTAINNNTNVMILLCERVKKDG